MVSIVQSVGHLSEYPQSLCQRDLLPSFDVTGSVHLLHDEVPGALGLAEVINAYHVVVQEPGGDLGFEPQLLADLLATLLLEQFDGHSAFEDLVGRRVDRPHAALAQLLLQEKPTAQRRADANHRETPADVIL